MVVLTVVATWLVPAAPTSASRRTARRSRCPARSSSSKRSRRGCRRCSSRPPAASSTAALIIGFCFIVGGAFGIIQKTGSIAVVIHSLALSFSRRPALRRLLIPVIMLVFSLGGAVFGMCEETMPFIVIFVPLALSLGYDRIIGVAMPFVGAAAGFAGAFFNPFTVGIAQGIAGLPLYSGLGFRFVVWAIGTAIAIAFVMRLRRARVPRPDAQPRRFAEDEEMRHTLALDKGAGEKVEVLPRHRLVLGVFAAGHGPAGRRHPALQVVHQRDRRPLPGARRGLGVAGRLTGEEASRAFTEGAKDMIGAALIIGCAARSCWWRWTAASSTPRCTRWRPRSPASTR